jgi:hypothetical protein
MRAGKPDLLDGLVVPVIRVGPNRCREGSALLIDSKRLQGMIDDRGKLRVVEREAAAIPSAQQSDGYSQRSDRIENPQA